MRVFNHVFTPDGGVYVSDDRAGDARLEEILKEYPTATVIIKDRDTQQPLTGAQSLELLLHVRNNVPF